MKWTVVTLADGERVPVNLATAEMIRPSRVTGCGSSIFFSSGAIHVRETPAQLKAIVLPPFQRRTPPAEEKLLG